MSEPKRKLSFQSLTKSLGDAVSKRVNKKLGIAEGIPMEFTWKSALQAFADVIPIFIDQMESIGSTYSKTQSWKNIRFKPDALHALSIPLRIEDGIIEEFSTDIDIKAFFQPPTKNIIAKTMNDGETRKDQVLFNVMIRGLKLKVSPSSRSESRNAEHREKYKVFMLAMHELLNNVFMHEEVGFMGLFIRTRFLIQDVQIIYIDPFEHHELGLYIRSLRQMPKPPRKEAEGEEKTSHKDKTPTSQFNLTDLELVHVFEEANETYTTQILGKISAIIVILHEYVAAAGDSEKITKRKKKSKKKKAAEGIAEGATLVVSLLNRLRVTLRKNTIPALLNVLEKVFWRLFDEDRGAVSHQLDLLRWFPLMGHAYDYWRFALRSAFPHIIREVADKLELKLGEDWTSTYGLMAPPENKDRYIHLFQRTLNLVGTEPLNTLEQAELKELQAQHSVDTLFLWRTEAKIRLLKERPDATSQVARRDFKELKGGVLGAVFAPFQEPLPGKELNSKEKRECYKKAMLYCRELMTLKQMEGVNISIVGSNRDPDMPALQCELIFDDLVDKKVLLALHEMNVEIDYNPERTLLQVIANRFQEVPYHGVQSYFQQEDGIVHYYTRFPTVGGRDPKQRLFNSLFLQHVDIMNVKELMAGVTEFFVTPLTKRESVLDTDGPGIHGEVYLDLIVADSIVLVPLDPAHGSEDSVTFQLGTPFMMKLIGEDNTVHPNFKGRFIMNPHEGSMTAEFTVHDIGMTWTSKPHDASLSLAERRAIKEGTARRHKPFTEELLRLVHQWTVKAQIQSVKVDDSTLSEFSFDLKMEQGQIKITQAILAQLLKVVALKLAADAQSRAEDDEATSKDRAPFSYRTALERFELVPDSQGGEHTYGNEKQNSKTSLDAFLLCISGMNMKTHELRKNPASAKSSKTIKGLVSGFVSKVLDHLLDGILRTNSPVVQNEGTAHISPIIERARQLILRAPAWKNDLVETAEVRIDNLLSWDIAKTDGNRFTGLSVRDLAAVIPQGASQTILDAQSLKRFLETEDPKSKERQANLRIKQRNCNYLTASVQDLNYCQESELPEDPHKDLWKKALVSRGNELEAEINDGIKLYADKLMHYPGMKEKRFLLTLKHLSVLFQARNKPFFDLTLKAVVADISRQEAPGIPPNIFVTSLRSQFDVRLLEGLLAVNLAQLGLAGYLQIDLPSNIHSLTTKLSHLLHRHAIFLARKATRDHRVYNTDLHFDDLTWKNGKREGTDTSFTLDAGFLLSLPYTFFADRPADELFGILTRAQLDMTITERKVQLTPDLLLASDDEVGDPELLKRKRSQSTVTRFFVESKCKNLEVMHVAPPDHRFRMEEEKELTQTQRDEMADPDDDFMSSKHSDQGRKHTLQSVTMPSLPKHVVSEKTNVRERNLKVIKKQAMQILDACNLNISLTIDDSELHAHSTKDELKRVRKVPGKYYSISAEFEDAPTMRLSTRDFYLFFNALLAMQNAKKAILRDFDVELRTLNELDLNIRSPKGLNMSLLDATSDIQGKNSILDMQFENLLSSFEAYHSSVKLLMSSTVALKYSVGGQPTPSQPNVSPSDARLADLLRPSPFRLLANFDSIGDIDMTKMLSLDLYAFQSLDVTLTESYIMQTHKRLNALQSLYERQAAAYERERQRKRARRLRRGGDSEDFTTNLMKSPTFGGKLQKAHIQMVSTWNLSGVADEIVQKTKHRTFIRNSTGSAIWFTRDNYIDCPPSVISAGGQVEVDLEEPVPPLQYDASASDFGVTISLDGGWEPKVKAELMPGFTCIEPQQSLLGPSFLKLKMKTVNVVCETIVRKLDTATEHGNPNDTVLVLNVHSSVRVVNSTDDAIALPSGVVVPKLESAWLAVMITSTGTLAMRPSGEHTWSKKVSYTLSADKDTHDPETNSLVRFQQVYCRHPPSGIPWHYSTKTTHNLETKITTVEVRAPVLITNCLPFPIVLSIRRPSKKKNIQFFFDPQTVSHDKVREQASSNTEQDPKRRFQWEDQEPSWLESFAESQSVSHSQGPGSQRPSSHPSFRIGSKMPQIQEHSESHNSHNKEDLANAAENVNVTEDFMDPYQDDPALQGASGTPAVDVNADTVSVASEESLPPPPPNDNYLEPRSVSFEQLDKKMYKASMNVNTTIERGVLQGSGAWNVHGGAAFNRGNLSISVRDIPSARCDGLFSKKRLNLSDPKELEAGWRLDDGGQTNRFLRIFVVDTVTDPEERKHFRNLRVFCHYVFLDRTGLQLRFSEDEWSYMRGHYQHPRSAVVQESRVAVSSHFDLNSQRVYRVSTPYCERWSKDCQIKSYVTQGAFDKENRDRRFKGEEELQHPGAEGWPSQHQILRVPCTMHFAADDPKHKGFSSASLLGKFATEVVLSTSHPLGFVGPTQVTCRPRVRIVNNLSCFLVVRQEDELSFRGKEPRDKELPTMIPGGRSAPLVFWDPQEDAEDPALINLNTLSFLPLFIGEDSSGGWEWSAPIPITRHKDYVVGLHNSLLNRRLILRIEVVRDGPHHVVFVNNHNIYELTFKVQNQSSQTSVRFMQRDYSGAAPSRKSFYWQTLHSGAVTTPFAWDDPTVDISGLPPKDSDLDSFQRPRLLTVRVFTHEKTFQTDVDLNPARVGTKKLIRMPGARPDILLQTRVEVSTGSIVLVVSDHVFSDQSPLHVYEAEEKKFMMALLESEVEHFQTQMAVSESQMYKPEPERVWVPNPSYQNLHVQIDHLHGVDMNRESDLVAVLTFGKITRKQLIWSKSLAKTTLMPQVFFFDANFKPGDIDYDQVLIDVYRRHTHHGTTLVCTATVRDVLHLTERGRVGTVEAILHDNTVQTIDPNAPPQVNAKPNFIRLRLHRQGRGLAGIKRVPGRQLMHVSVRCPELLVAIADKNSQQLMASVGHAHSKSLSDVIDDNAFLHMRVTDARFVRGLTHTHDYLAILAQNATIWTKHADDVNEIMLLDADSSSGKRFLSLAVLQQRKSIPAFDFVYESNVTGHAIKDGEFNVSVIDKVVLSMRPPHVMIHDYGLHFMRILRFLGHLDVVAHMESAYLDHPTAVFVGELQQINTALHIELTNEHDLEQDILVNQEKHMDEPITLDAVAVQSSRVCANAFSSVVKPVKILQADEEPQGDDAIPTEFESPAAEDIAANQAVLGLAGFHGNLTVQAKDRLAKTPLQEVFRFILHQYGAQLQAQLPALKEEFPVSFKAFEAQFPEFRAVFDKAKQGDLSQQ